MIAGWDELIACDESSSDSNKNAENSNGNVDIDDNSENDDSDVIITNGKSEPSTAGKRSVRLNATEDPRVKRSRYEKVSDSVLQGLQDFQQIYVENIKKNDKLQEELDNLKDTKKSLMLKTVKLAKENKSLIQIVAALEAENIRFVDEKKDSEDRYMALRNASDKEKESFEREKMSLREQNKALEMEKINFYIEKKKSDAEKRELEKKIAELECFKSQIFQLSQPCNKKPK